MVILGIDPGTATTGYGVIEIIHDQPQFVQCGVITTPAGMMPAERLDVIRNDLHELIATFRPQRAGVEQLYFSTNVKTAISVAQARGVILQTLFAEGVHIQEFNPLEVKNTVAGYGNADKKQMQEAVRLQLGLNKVPTPDDAADAVGVALCAWFRREM